MFDPIFEGEMGRSEMVPSISVQIIQIFNEKKPQIYKISKNPNNRNFVKYK